MFRLGLIGKSNYLLGCMERWGWGEKLRLEGIQVTAWLSDYFDGSCFSLPGTISLYSRDKATEFFQLVDGVWIATAPENHVADVTNTLGNEKHTLCEKPLSITASGTQLILYAHEKVPRLTLAVGYQLPFHTQFSRFKALLNQLQPLKAIQIVDRRGINVETVFGCRRKKPNIISEFGTHYFHLIGRLLDVDISDWKNLAAETFCHQIDKVADEVTITFSAKGIEVMIHLSWCDGIVRKIQEPSRQRSKWIHAIGSGSSLTMDLIDPSWPITAQGHADIQPHAEPDDPSLKQLLAFVSSAQNGKLNEALCSGQEGFNVVKFTQRIQTDA